MKILILTIALIFSIPAAATDMVYIETGGKQVYFVSGVLRKADNSITIKLAHSIEYVTSEEDAIIAFTKKVIEMYPGYSIETTLATGTKVQNCGIEL